MSSLISASALYSALTPKKTKCAGSPTHYPTNNNNDTRTSPKKKRDLEDTERHSFKRDSEPSLFTPVFPEKDALVFIKKDINILIANLSTLEYEELVSTTGYIMAKLGKLMMDSNPMLKDQPSKIQKITTDVT
jgi:hypothetical protein